MSRAHWSFALGQGGRRVPSADSSRRLALKAAVANYLALADQLREIRMASPATERYLIDLA